jgi:hypothetical protein
VKNIPAVPAVPADTTAGYSVKAVGDPKRSPRTAGGFGGKCGAVGEMVFAPRRGF